MGDRESAPTLSPSKALPAHKLQSPDSMEVSSTRMYCLESVNTLPAKCKHFVGKVWALRSQSADTYRAKHQAVLHRMREFDFIAKVIRLDETNVYHTALSILRGTSRETFVRFLLNDQEYNLGGMQPLNDAIVETICPQWNNKRQSAMCRKTPRPPDKQRNGKKSPRFMLSKHKSG